VIWRTNYAATRFAEEDTWIKCVNNVTAEVFDGRYAVVDGYALTTVKGHPKAIDGHHYGDCHVKTQGQVRLEKEAPSLFESQRRNRRETEA
jgi:hypothetical protein